MNRGRAFARLALVGLVIGSLAACDEDPVEVHDHEEGDVSGFRLDAIAPGGGRTALLVYDGPTQPDTLFLPAASSTEIEIVWLDDEGHEIEVHADEHDWELESNNEAIVGFTPAQGDSWRGTIVTADVETGETVFGTYTVTLLHGDEAEFQTVDLVAAVE